MSEVSAACKDPAPPKKAGASCSLCGCTSAPVAVQDFPRTLQGFEQLPLAR